MIQTSVKILAIAPYEEMQTLMKHALENYNNVEMDIYVADLEDGVAIVKNMQHNLYDCIISRGGTASLIRNLTYLPVISIKLSVYDILSTIKLAEHYSNKYAIVGFPNITETAHTLCSILGSNIDIITVNTKDEVFNVLVSLKKQGYHMVVGDKVTHTLAKNLSMESFLITSGVESIQDAINQAIDICTHFSKLRQENTFLRMIVQDQNSFMVIMDLKGNILQSSPTNPSNLLIESLHQNLVGIPTSRATRFYCIDKEVLYKITSQTVIMNNTPLCLFYCVPSRIPLNAHLQKGVRFMNKKECEYILSHSFYSISGAMGKLSDVINALTNSRQAIMILGEQGTGKEQIAKYLYVNSSISNRPFVMINCELLNDKGYDYLLNNDNSPLNEINTTVYFQNFEHFKVSRLGELLVLIAETGLSMRNRLIFSSTYIVGQNIIADVTNFMQRLACVNLILPTLRSREDEIASLASMYLGNLKLRTGKQLLGFEPKALNMLRTFPWPGNYTQFKKILETLATITLSGYIKSTDVAEILAKENDIQNLVNTTTTAHINKSLTLNEIIKATIIQAIKDNHNNRSKAAKQLGISRSTLWRYLR